MKEKTQPERGFSDTDKVLKQKKTTRINVSGEKKGKKKTAVVKLTSTDIDEAQEEPGHKYN